MSARLIDNININSTKPVLAPPIQERRRAVRAMEEMIILAKEYIRTARPQVRFDQ